MVTQSSSKLYHLFPIFRAARSLLWCSTVCERPHWCFLSRSNKCYLKGGKRRGHRWPEKFGTILCSEFHPQGNKCTEIRLCVLDSRKRHIELGCPGISQKVCGFRLCSKGEQIKVSWSIMTLLANSWKLTTCFHIYQIIGFFQQPCESGEQLLLTHFTGKESKTEGQPPLICITALPD